MFSQACQHGNLKSSLNILFQFCTFSIVIIMFFLLKERLLLKCSFLTLHFTALGFTNHGKFSGTWGWSFSPGFFKATPQSPITFLNVKVPRLFSLILGDNPESFIICLQSIHAKTLKQMTSLNLDAFEGDLENCRWNGAPPVPGKEAEACTGLEPSAAHSPGWSDTISSASSHAFPPSMSFCAPRNENFWGLQLDDAPENLQIFWKPKTLVESSHSCEKVIHKQCQQILNSFPNQNYKYFSCNYCFLSLVQKTAALWHGSWSYKMWDRGNS